MSDQKMTQEERAAKTDALALTSMEWGFRACEKGMNLDMALVAFTRVLVEPVNVDAVDPAVPEKVERSTRE